MRITTRIALVWVFFIFTSAAWGEDEAFFPVMPWNNIPNDPAVLAKIKECGFTVAGFVAPDALDNCQKVGLKGIVSDARASGYSWGGVDEADARKKVESLVNEVGKHPAVFGYYLRDEPGKGSFAGLAKVASAIHELSPGKWAYINLFPNYANAQQLEDENYEKYLEDFVAACHPMIMSYDHYALLDDGSLRDGYWQNLEQMRAASVKHDIPFWNIVLAVAHFSYREPTQADLRFEVYSTLAYGGRGISYFTYFAPQVGNYRAAAIDQFGNETPTWRHLQNVNLQIQKLAPTINKLKSDAVYHLGTVPNGCHGPGENSLIKGGEASLMVGDFTHKDGSRYVMVVNRNVEKSRVCSVEWRTAPKSVQMVSPYTGQLTGFEGEQVWLAPGQGVLLKAAF